MLSLDSPAVRLDDAQKQLCDAAHEHEGAPQELLVQKSDVGTQFGLLQALLRDETFHTSN